jgi:Fur family peroxide stress response transcriptional regulator
LTNELRTITDKLVTDAPTAAKMLEALRATGCRITAQRLAIVNHLANRTDHPSARSIYDALVARESELSLATVYNTLATLADHGLVLELDYDGAENRYDTNTRPHINLHCTTCGTIIDVPVRPPVSLDEILEAEGFETTDCRMEYRGRCARCRANGRT